MPTTFGAEDPDDVDRDSQINSRMLDREPSICIQSIKNPLHIDQLTTEDLVTTGDDGPKTQLELCMLAAPQCVISTTSSPPSRLCGIEAEIDDLTDKFQALMVAAKPFLQGNSVERPTNKGKWPSVGKVVGYTPAIEEKRYEANLLMLMHTFALKPRHEYVLTKRWPDKPIEQCAMSLKRKVQKVWDQGTREDDEEVDRDYLGELDWYWRYWGKSEWKVQVVWAYVVGLKGLKARIYSKSAGAYPVTQQAQDQFVAKARRAVGG